MSFFVYPVAGCPILKFPEVKVAMIYVFCTVKLQISECWTEFLSHFGTV